MLHSGILRCSGVWQTRFLCGFSQASKVSKDSKKNLNRNEKTRNEEWWANECCNIKSRGWKELEEIKEVEHWWNARGGGLLFLAKSKQGHKNWSIYPSLEIDWCGVWEAEVVEVLSVCMCFSVPNSQQGAPKKYRLSPLESNPSVVLIWKEWRDGGWGDFIYLQKHKQMSNMVLMRWGCSRWWGGHRGWKGCRRS